MSLETKYAQLAEYTIKAKYARYNKKAGRRETWTEQINRVVDGTHKIKFEKQLKGSQELSDYLEVARTAMLEKKVLGSQRILQFGGPSALKKNMRIYNCAASYVDRVRVFQETMYVLLCGTGSGFSVQKHHIAKLPELALPNNDLKKEYTVPDTIEGWADSIGVLLSSFFVSEQTFPEYFGCDVVYDFSLIRPKGSSISDTNGKAPGYKPLKNALQKIKNVVYKCFEMGLKKLRPIDAYDIITHVADSVLAGGVRRSALLTMFSPDDEEMLHSKTGSWFIENPQRGRSNNSVVLLRETTTAEQFSNIMESVKEFGEPGFIWTDDLETLFNPCVPDDTWIMTSEGSVQVKDLLEKPFTAIVDGKPYESKTGFIKTGHKQLFKIVTEEGMEVRATANHKILNADREWVQLQTLVAGDKISIHDHTSIGFNPNRQSIDFKRGFELGELYAHDDCCLNDDEFNLKIAHCDVETQSLDFQAGFVDGFYEYLQCDSRIVSSRKTALQIIQRINLRLGVYGKICEFREDTYCGLSSGPVVYQYDRWSFEYHSDKRTFDQMFIATVKEIIPDDICDVYDCTVDDIHAFDANGFYVHNCVEISMRGYDCYGNSGFQLCNLSEINMEAVKTPEDFYSACESASILGTFQAGYTDFGYVTQTTINIVEREALIGCSMTGMMDCPDIAFNPEILKKGASIIKDMNRKVAKLLGINPAARTTCVKPAGTTSCILGTSSGIHPRHAKRYFRRVQANKDESTLAFFRKYNPSAVEHCVWSNNGTDDIVTFLCKAPEKARTKDDVNAIELLSNVKLVQEYWVNEGTNIDLCVVENINHNVSNTINVAPNEWEGTTSYIYDNRKFFTGVSILPESGDKDYAQVPFQTVLTEVEIAEKYGPAASFASGLIVHAHNAFSGNLYDACSCFLGTGEQLSNIRFDDDKVIDSIDKVKVIIAKRLWIEQAKKFTNRYFAGNRKNMTYCLKDVNALKSWCDLEREYVSVPWDEFYEGDDNTRPMESVACSGGVCELISFS